MLGLMSLTTVVTRRRAPQRDQVARVASI